MDLLRESLCVSGQRDIEKTVCVAMYERFVRLCVWKGEIQSNYVLSWMKKYRESL
ncbi:hypothetical protein COLO4_36370 [Corchorus olitorius]|uniref:Uncharacterized protein n=1 Tax=Corchorus olitorius TaxID=93759 RepID=A0A1R3G975_9ROSI|nr:hypothetical protein COLO4_36370 [Corchorus olitorius]